MATSASRAAPRRGGDALHEGFLRHARFRWLKIALALCMIAGIGYALIDVRPRPNGGSPYGYALGTIATLLILWLTALGLRKRTMTRGRWSLKAWTSAHVYLGLSLIVIATLHTGFQLGWNVHTLAYALMMLVIASGIWGVIAYATIPKALGSNRDEMTQNDMLESLRAIDRQLHQGGQPLSGEDAKLVQASLAQNPFGGGLRVRLAGQDRRCATAAAHDAIRARLEGRPNDATDPLDRVDALLERKRAMLSRLRRHLRLKALLEIWLYLHVPLTFALIAALVAHIVSVFFYW